MLSQTFKQTKKCFRKFWSFPTYILDCQVVDIEVPSVLEFFCLAVLQSNKQL